MMVCGRKRLNQRRPQSLFTLWPWDKYEDCSSRSACFHDMLILRRSNSI